MTGTEHGAHIGFDDALASVFRGSGELFGYLDVEDHYIEPVVELVLLTPRVEVIVSSFKIESGLSRSLSGVG
ncbi:MAG: hypothetical protein IIB54_15460 [Planctomycetes bacterium]|nr:hypothetical protein [Planctomycetota bacterium]